MVYWNGTHLKVQCDSANATRSGEYLHQKKLQHFSQKAVGLIRLLESLLYCHVRQVYGLASVEQYKFKTFIMAI